MNMNFNGMFNGQQPRSQQSYSYSSGGGGNQQQQFFFNGNGQQQNFN